MTIQDFCSQTNSILRAFFFRVTFYRERENARGCASGGEGEWRGTSRLGVGGMLGQSQDPEIMT